MTVPEAARILEVTPALVYALCSAGRIRHRRIGLGRGVIRIDPEHLEEFRRSCEVAPTPPAEEVAAERPRARGDRVPDYFEGLAERKARRATESGRQTEAIGLKGTPVSPFAEFDARRRARKEEMKAARQAESRRAEQAPE